MTRAHLTRPSKLEPHFKKNSGDDDDDDDDDYDDLTNRHLKK